MDEKKRCPLLEKNKDGIVEVCGEKKCAWWNEDVYENQRGCSLQVIAKMLVWLKESKEED